MRERAAAVGSKLNKPDLTVVGTACNAPVA
jgi:hypothetical protein